MTGLWATAKIVLILSVLGYGAWYAVKKAQKGQYNRMGEKGRIQVLDGISLNHQTSTYLMKVDEQKVFVVVGQNGVNIVHMKEKTFQELIEDGLEVGNEDE